VGWEFCLGSVSVSASALLLGVGWNCGEPETVGMKMLFWGCACARDLVRQCHVFDLYSRVQFMVEFYSMCAHTGKNKVALVSLFHDQ
jgi:hypothetical protein